MKLLKRLTALALSAAMVLSMGVSALATEGNPPAANPEDDPIVCTGEADIDCLAETHIEGCDEFIEEPVLCDGSLNCQATENHQENCLFVLAQQPVVVDGGDDGDAVGTAPPTITGYSLRHKIGANAWVNSAESVIVNNVEVGTSVEIGLLAEYNDNSKSETELEQNGERLFAITYQEGNETKHLSNVSLVGNGGNKYARFTIPSSLAGKTLTFTPTVDGAENLSVTINVAAPDYTLKMKGTDGSWTPIGDKIPMKIGEPVTLSLYDKDGNKINLVTGDDSEKNFRAYGNGAQIKFLGDGTVQLFVVANGNVRLEYGLKNNKQYEWSNIVALTDPENAFQWYVNGEESGITHTVNTSNSVFVTLKKGTESIPLNNSNCRVQSGNYTISFAGGGFNLSAKSGNVNVRYYYATNTNGTPDTSVYFEFVLKNTNAGPYFVHQKTTESLDEYTFSALAAQNSELGTLTVYLNGGSSGTVDTDELKMSNFSVWNEDGQTQISDFSQILTLEQKRDNNGNPSNHVIIKAVGTGDNTTKRTVILKYADDGYDENTETRYAQMQITIDSASISYALYGDNEKPLVLERGTAYGDSIARENVIVVKKLVDGAATDEMGIKSITAGTCVDQNGFASADDAAKSLYVEKNNEGQWAVYTANYKAGEYHLPITVELDDGSDDGIKVSFTLKYTVAAGDSSDMHFYVGTDKPFKTIQEALNAAMANDTASMRYIHIDEGTYTASDANNNSIDGTETEESKRDGILELHLDGDKGYTNFSIIGEGNGVTIKGYLVCDPLEGRLPVVLNNITFEHPDYTANKPSDDNKPAIKVIHDSHNDRDALTLQNVTIRGYDIGMSGNPFAQSTRNVVIENCNVGLQLGVTNNDADNAPQQIVYRDGSNYVLRNFTFRNNNTAIQILPAAEGKLKLRDNLFIDNSQNIVNNSSSCSVNAAFNTYGADDYSNLVEAFSLKNNDFFSPYYRAESTYGLRSTTAKTAYIDNSELNDGLIIDAKEANTAIDTANFAGQKVSVSIATVADDGVNTTASNYATWSFPASSELKSDTFNPLIEYELEETVPSDVTAYQPVHFEHHNELPSTATVNLKATNTITDTDGDGLYLYKVVDGKLVLQDEGVICENGIYTFDRPTCSDYIITDTLIKEETIQPDEGGDDDEQGGSEGGNTGSGDNTQGGSSAPSYDYSDDDEVSNTNDFISAGEVEDKLDSSKSDKVTMSVVTRDKVAKKAFDELAASGKTLVLKGSGYSWTIDGDDIDGKLSTPYFKTAVNENSPYKAKVKALVGDAEYQIIYTEQHGKLPGKFTLTLKVSEELQDKLLYLYYYNPLSSEAEALANGLKADKKGYVTIVFDEHLSTYFLTDKPLGSETVIDKVNPSTGAATFPKAAALALCALSCTAVFTKKKA